ncbi:zinc finger CCCH domain-containing protein 17 [Silene latifolia]|uniref:zinc finger CCCH domain-containing protein 17 n=1 Tax=Silene latifolia TaxID=37657 RepID=UPI003D76C766
MATAGEKPPQQVQPPASTAEDDLWKHNTDCVYFLASPLTCKKGSQCEYRHSEAARGNPRDCYYWLNGTCLNANCGFRHPPLDVMVPPQGGSYAGPSPLMPPSGAPFASIPQNAAKQAVPCIFFQRGVCSKGDKCHFMHGAVPLPNTKIQPGVATTASTEMPSFKKTFGASEKGPQPKMNVYSNASKSIETPRQPQANAALKVVKPRLMEQPTAAKRYPSPGVIEEAPKFKETVPPLAANGSLRSRAARPHRSGSVDDEYYQNGKDVDDSFRESSPGFDVLVDDKLEEDEYYHNDDQYVRLRGQEGRRTSEFDIESRDDYISANDVNHDIYHSKHGYRAYDGLVDKYPREQRQASSERQTIHDRRGPYKPESTDFVPNSSDLRHRLSKQRRDNGLRSVISPDYKADYHREDRGYQSSRRDARRSPTRESTRESSFGSRLQGRIKLPRRSPPGSVGNMYSGRGNDRVRNSGILSPSRPQQSSLQGRLRDRLSGRIQEESNEDRNFRGQMRKDSTFEDSIDGFAPPKRLSELRVNKHTGNSQVTTGKLRDTVLASSHTHDGDISFDGPKPLSEILKRKRNATPASTRAVNCDNEEGKTGKPAALSLAPEQTQGDVQENNEAQIAEADEEEVGEISTKKVKLLEDESSLLDDDKHQEVVEEGLFGGDEQGPEIDEEFDQGEGEDPEVDEELEYDYEQDDEVEGYNLNEGEVADNEGFMDEDDGDDFAKKLGVSF